jgi:hypothetical protein
MRLPVCWVEGDVAGLVADQQWIALESVELVIQAALALGIGEQSDPLGGGAEDDALASQARADRQRDRQVRLPGAGQARAGSRFHSHAGSRAAEMLDHLLLNRALEVGSKSCSVLRAGKCAARMRA